MIMPEHNNQRRHPEQTPLEIELPVLPEIEQETIPEIGPLTEQTQHGESGKDGRDDREFE